MDTGAILNIVFLKVQGVTGGGGMRGQGNHAVQVCLSNNTHC